MSQQAIADKFGVDRKVITLRLQRAGVQLRTRSEATRVWRGAAPVTPADIVRVKRHYEGEGRTIKEVAGLIGRSHAFVVRVMKVGGIRPRLRGRLSVYANSRYEQPVFDEDAVAFDSHERGLTRKVVAFKYGISVQRVRAVLKRVEARRCSQAA